MYEFETKGTCASKIKFDLRDGQIHSLSFENGCEGNLKALGVLTEGMDAALAVKKLKGITCGGSRDGKTSCADQLAQALEKLGTI